MTTNLVALQAAAARRCVICRGSPHDARNGPWVAADLCAACVGRAIDTLRHIVSLHPPEHTREPLAAAATVLQEMIDDE